MSKRAIIVGAALDPRLLEALAARPEGPDLGSRPEGLESSSRLDEHVPRMHDREPDPEQMACPESESGGRWRAPLEERKCSSSLKRMLRQARRRG